MSKTQTRRRFLTSLPLAGATGLIRTPEALAGEAPPETTSVRFLLTPSLCHAPQFVAEDLLRAEGFTDIKYIEGKSSAEINEAVTSGRVDFNTHFAPQWVSVIDSGGPVTVLSGVHVGCFELFGKQGIRSIADLKGKSVGVAALGSSDHLFISVMAAHIGLDPVNEINWIISQSPTPAELFADEQDRRLPRSAARAPGTSRPTYRPRNRQQRYRPPLVAIFLLYAGRQP